MPVRLLTQSLLRWPDPETVLAAVRSWAQQQALACPSLLRIGVYGSYGRGDAGVGSDLDLVLIDADAIGPQSARYRRWPFEELPLSCDALVLTPGELDQLLTPPSAQSPAAAAMSQALRQDLRWIWSCPKALSSSLARHPTIEISGDVIEPIGAPWSVLE